MNDKRILIFNKIYNKIENSKNCKELIDLVDEINNFEIYLYKQSCPDNLRADAINTLLKSLTLSSIKMARNARYYAFSKNIGRNK